MKRIIALLILLIIICEVSFASTSGGMIGIDQRIGVDAGIEGAGRVFESLSHDINSIYYNPAGLTGLRKHMFMGSYLPLWDASTFSFFTGLAFDLNYLPIGIGVLNTMAGDIRITSDSPLVQDITGFQDTVIMFASGYSLWKKLSIGARLNMIYHKIYEYSDWAFGSDLSLLWKDFSDSISFGLVVQNLLPPSIKLKKESENYPFRLKSGISFKFHYIEPGAAVNYLPQHNYLSVNTGVEFNFQEMFFLRTGYKVMDENFSVGAGIDMRNIAADFSMTFLKVSKNLYMFDFKVKF